MLASWRSICESASIRRYRLIDTTNKPVDLMKNCLRKIIPPSITQQSVWLMSRLASNKSLFNLLWRVTFRGLLDQKKLFHSLRVIIERHEPLRATFNDESGDLVQQIAAECSFIGNLDDNGIIGKEEEYSSLDASVLKFGFLPFDLGAGPLIRCRLYQSRDDEFQLLIAFHHLVMDGGSWPIFMDELVAAYADVLIPPLSLKYSDYIHRQQQLFSSDAWKVHERYWRNHVTGERTTLELLYDFPPPITADNKGDIHRLALTPELTRSLKQLAHVHGSTLFRTLMAAFIVMLYRLTGRREITLGTTLVGRHQPELKKLIGYFNHVVALKVAVSGNITFSCLIRQVHQILDEALAHDEYPFDLITRSLENRDERSPGMFTAINFTKLPSCPSCNLPGLEISEERIFLPLSLNEFTLYTQETDTGLQLIGEFASALFAPETIASLMERFVMMLQEAVSNPRLTLNGYLLSRLKQRSMQPQSSGKQVTSDSLVPFSRDAVEQSIPARFEQQVNRHGRRIAVVTAEGDWTYRRLNQEAEKIARAIVKEQIHDPGNIVLLMSHDAYMIAAIIGVLKAGKAYVPLVAQTPLARLIHILNETAASLIITNRVNAQIAATLSSGSLPIINVEDLGDAGAHHLKGDDISPAAVAYILYTSGSTGLPKGIIQNHHQVLFHIRNYTNRLSIHSGDRLTLISSYAFDAAVMDIFGALLNGATLFLIDIHQDGLPYLNQTMNDGGITIYHSTPTVFRLWIDTLGDKMELPQLRLVVLGGEELYARDVERFYQRVSSGCHLINGLGPTESTLALQYELGCHTALPRKKVPVGFPVDDTEIFLLNEAGETNDWVGEIAIRSSGVANGYWHQPELTNKVFIPDPDGGTRRIYHTGDLGRLLPDGAIEYVGRKDWQVKLHGYRIELNEIESVITDHPTVRQAVVVLHGEQASEQRLVAYIVPSGKAVMDGFQYQDFLKDKLPEYMLPSEFIMLSTMPMTFNGKINRRALPMPAPVSPAIESTAMTSADDLEMRLISIWRRILNNESFGIDDDFFTLGGNSLMAIRMLAAIEKEFDRRLSLTQILKFSTIARLAQLVSQNKGNGENSSLVSLHPHGHKIPLFFLHVISGNIRYGETIARYLAPDQPVYGFIPPMVNGEFKAYKRIEEMAAGYIQELGSIHPTGPFVLACWSWGVRVTYEMAQQLHRQGLPVALVIIIDAFFHHRHLLASPSNTVHLMPYFLKNLGFWIFNTLQNPPPNLLATFSRLIRKINRRLFRKMHHTNIPFFQPDVEDLMQYHEQPTYIRRMIDDHWQAALAYVPQAYPAKITLFKARARPLFHSLEPDLGWGRLAQGGVEVITVPGNHLTIVQEPRVKILAEKLQMCLDRIDGNG